MQHIGISLMQVKKIVLCHKRWITFMIMLLLLYHHTELPVFLTPYILFSLQITTFIYSKINLWAICELMHSWV